jgi:hypothetical protein
VRILADRADALLAEARSLGFTVEEAIDLVRRRSQALAPDPEEG